MTKTNNDFSFDFEENNGLVYDAVQLLDNAQDLAENFAEVVIQYERNASDTNANAVAFEASRIRKQMMTLIKVSQQMLEDSCQASEQMTSKYVGKSFERKGV